MTLAAESGHRRGWLRHPMAALADRLGITEGNAYTALIALVLAVTLALAGIPPTLRTVRHVTPFAAASRAPSAPVVPSAAPAASLPAVGTGPVATAPVTSPGITSAPSTEGAIPATEPAIASPPAFGTVTSFATAGPPGALHGAAVAADGTVYVVTDNADGPSHVLAFGPGGTLTHDFTVTGQPATHARGLTGVALDGRGSLLVLDAATARVLRLDLASGAQSTLAAVPDVGPCALVIPQPCEPGIQDHHPLPIDVAVTTNGDALITDAGQDTIWRLRGNALEHFFSTPTITNGDGPAGITIDHEGVIWFTAANALDQSNPTALVTGGVFRLPVDGSGNAGTAALVWRTTCGPIGITAGAGGNLYVALAGMHAVVAITPAGNQVARIDHDFLGPTGIGFRGRSLIVTDHKAAADGRWTVWSMFVDDEAA